LELAQILAHGRNDSHNHETQPQPQPAFIGDQFPILHPVSGRDSAARMIMPVGFNCAFEFEKGRQLLICMHNKASSIAPLCGHNPNCRPL